MVFGINKANYPGYGGKNDIKLSLLDYYNMLDSLKDYNFSMSISMKFKNLYMSNAYATFATMILSAVTSYGGMRLIANPLKGKQAAYRLTLPMMSFFWILSFNFFIHKPIKRRLYTEIFTNDTEDGEYLRETMRERNPNIWRYISSQMHTLGHNFKEMDEYNVSEFPTALMK